MKIEIPGIVYNSQREAGSCIQYGFGLVGGSEIEALTALLSVLPAGTEIGFPDPANGDCELEVRRTKNGFEAKRGCHGAHGTWRLTTEQEALAWLMPGALSLSKTARPGFGGMLTYHR